MPAHASFDRDAPIRVGVHRPNRPPVVVATAEARVVRVELERRLGAVTLDLRVDGDNLGPWASMAHAAWPADVDVVIAPNELWGPSLPPLTTVFARTVEPVAAEVRRRMLHHLGLLPIDRLDEAALEPLGRLALRPTDLWLIVSAATHVDLSDPTIAAFGTRPNGDASALLDDAFDLLIAEWPEPLAGQLPARLERSIMAAHAANNRCASAADELVRTQREAADLIDELTAQLDVLRERVERIDLQRTMASDDDR